MIFVNINWTICWRILRFLSITFLSMSRRVLRRSPTTELLKLPQRYTTTSYGGPMPNCSPQFLPQRIFPFLYSSSTRRLSSLFCTQSDTRIAIYIMVAFVFSQVKMAGWQMDRKDRGVDEEKGRRSSTWKDESLRFECYCET